MAVRAAAGSSVGFSWKARIDLAYTYLAARLPAEVAHWF
jgi:hypothetical protein